MSKFVLLYEGGSMPQTPEDGEKVRDAWMAWFAKAGGATLPDSGVNGYTLVEGDSLAGVTAMIGDHPHLAAGGRIEVHAQLDPLPDQPGILDVIEMDWHIDRGATCDLERGEGDRREAPVVRDAVLTDLQDDRARYAFGARNDRLRVLEQQNVECPDPLTA